jgi:alcohol dehydrogenase
MKAILVDAPGAPLRPDEVDAPPLPPHGARVEVRATGVCRSDWHAWVGHDATISWPHVPGHEFAGVVIEVGPEVRAVRPGMRVTAPFCCGCGSCATCRDGLQNLCEREYQPGFDGWGSFAESVVVPWADVNVVTLPEAMGFDAAAALGCRFMTAFAGLIDHGALRPGETVAVLGAGGLGLAAIAIAAAAGARVAAVDLDDAKLDLARALGATAAIDARAGDPVAALRDALDGGAHVSVDALGSPVTAAQGIRALRPRGRHVQLGLLLGDQAAPPVPMFELIKRELRIVGGHGMPAHRYPEMLRFVHERGIDVGAWIGARRPLAEADAAMRELGAFGTTGVTVLVP